MRAAQTHGIAIYWAARKRRSAGQPDFYSPNGIKFNETVAWYSAHLAGFKQTHGYTRGRANHTFYKPDGTVVVSITGDVGKEGENADTYAVSYEAFQPALPEKAILGFSSGNIVCQ